MTKTSGRFDSTKVGGFSVRDLGEFLDGYMACAVWLSRDESTPSGGEPLDENYSTSDFTVEARRKMSADCAKFMRENAEDLRDYCAHVVRHEGAPCMGYAGHDFWLTRNGRGAGFWDRDGVGAAGRPKGPEGLGERLSDAARRFGEQHVWVRRRKLNVE